VASRDELIAVRPGAALRLRGDEFVVERCIRFDEPGGGWWEHRLSSHASGSSLWLEIPADPGAPIVAYERSDLVGGEPEGGEEMAGDRRVSYERRDLGPWEVSSGREIEAAEIELLG
jgi:hypothetical protein